MFFVHGCMFHFLNQHSTQYLWVIKHFNFVMIWTIILIPKLVRYNLVFLFSLAGPGSGVVSAARTDVLTQPTKLSSHPSGQNLPSLFWSLHYWLRPIESVQFRFDILGSHFIRVQIFQIDFLLTPSILSASKYFRYSCRWQNELFSVSLSVIIIQWKNLNYWRREKGTTWTMFNVA